MKKMLLIVPTGRYSFGTQICSPTRLLLITGYLQQHFPNIECEIIDMHLWGIPLNEKGEKKLIDRLMNELGSKVNDETIIGFSIMANYEILHILPMLKQIKENFDSPVIIGGYAATTCHQVLLEHCHSLFDAICLGAGELPVVEMFKNFKNGKVDFAKVPNLVYWEDGIKSTAITPPLNYDDLPVIDFSLLKGDLEKYNAISFSTGRGCAWNCEFCQEKKLYPKFSTRSRKKVEKDMENLCRFTDNKLLNLSDPLFGLDYRSSKETVETLNSYGFNYQFGSRCDVFPEQLYKDMDGHCKIIFFGFESANPERLLQMLKTKDPVKYINQMKEQLKRCFENDVFGIVAVIINYPKNTTEDIRKVLEFSKEIEEIYKNHPTDNGYLYRTYPFYIYYGDYYSTILEQLRSEGLTDDYVYPEQYHGIPVPQEIEIEIKNSSRDLNFYDLYSHWENIYNSSKIWTDKCRDILRGFYGPSLSPIRDNKVEYPEFYTDNERNILDLSSIIVNLEELNNKYPQLTLKDPRTSFGNPFKKWR